MRILILGATGMMGHAACRVLSQRHEVHGTGRSGWDRRLADRLALTPDRWIGGVETARPDSVAAALERVKPDAVLNCIGIVKQLDEARNALLSIEVNALFPHRLALLCGVARAKLIHMSTDCVFSGRKGHYTEEDVPDPVDTYGRSKLLGEVGEHGALTLRTSIIGRQLRGQTGLLEWFISQRGGKVKGFARAVYTGLTTVALARIVDQLLTKQGSLSGVWQVASAPITKYDLLTKLNEKLGLNVEIERDETFSCDRSLDGSRFVQATGIEVPGWDRMIGELEPV